jgi:hypothetical protein
MVFHSLDKIFSSVRETNSIPDACYALTPLFDQYEVISLGLTRGSIFWRARSCELTPWPSTTDMGPPPAEKTKTGRLNDAGQPMLYASLNEETALAEIGAVPGQHYQMIGYRVLVDECLRLAVVGEMMHVHKFGYIRLTGIDPDGSLARLMNTKEQLKARQLLYIDAFLHKLLSDPAARETQYIHSRAVAAMIHRNKEIDGIAYPSARDPLGYNITIKPDVAEKKIHSSACFQCHIDSMHEFGFTNYHKLQEAEQLDESGNFIWKAPLPIDQRRLFNLTEKEYQIGLDRKNDPNVFMHLKRAHQNH